MTRVLLADDHRLLVDGLRPLLEAREGLEVVAIAADGREAVELAVECEPDIIFLDISMPRLNGIDAAKEILRELPDTRIIMLSMHADRRFIQESLRAGACGYILKESAATEVMEAVDLVLEGELYFSQSVRDRVLRDYTELIRVGEGPSASPLSLRERGVLQLLAEGKSTKDMAGILNVSVKTIESHRKRIMDRLGLHTVAELTKYAIREGLTPLE